jgi:hypothetical protein
MYILESIIYDITLIIGIYSIYVVAPLISLLSFRELALYYYYDNYAVQDD